MVLRDVIGALVFTPIAAAIGGKASGMRFGSSWTIAVACYAPLVVLHLVLNLFGAGPGHCMGFWLWPALLTVLVCWRTRAHVSEGVRSGARAPAGRRSPRPGLAVAPRPPFPRTPPVAPPPLPSATGAAATPRPNARPATARVQPLAARARARRPPAGPRLQPWLWASAIVIVLMLGLVLLGNRLLSRSRLEMRTRLALDERFASFGALSRPGIEGTLEAAHPGCFEGAFRLGLVSARLDERRYRSCIDQAVAARLGRILRLHSPEIAEHRDPRWWQLSFVVEKQGEDEVPAETRLHTESVCGSRGPSSSETGTSPFVPIDARTSRASTLLYNDGVPCEHRLTLAHGGWPLGPPLVFRTPLDAAPSPAPDATR